MSVLRGSNVRVEPNVKKYLTEKNHQFDPFAESKMVDFVRKDKNKFVKIFRPVTFMPGVDEMISLIEETRKIGPDPLFKIGLERAEKSPATRSVAQL